MMLIVNLRGYKILKGNKMMNPPALDFHLICLLKNHETRVEEQREVPNEPRPPAISPRDLMHNINRTI